MARKAVKRRCSEKVCETTPNVRQLKFPHQDKVIKADGPVSSRSPALQQTITQMRLFHDLYHPQVNAEDLEYEEETQDVYIESQRSTKRRKLSGEKTPLGRMTRSAKRVLAAPRPSTEPAVSARDSGCPPPSTQDAIAMPPPQTTPKRIRRREIPSSQSPVESPLSTQDWRSIRETSRSPLKERSTNVKPIRSPTSKHKSVRWAFTSEIPDSLEDIDDVDTTAFEVDIHSIGLPDIEDRHPEEKCQRGPILDAKPRLPEQGPNASIEGQNGNYFRPSAKTQAVLASSAQKPLRLSSILPEDELPGPAQRTDHAILSNPLVSSILESASQAAASIQLLTDLAQATQPPEFGVETESQFENAWHSYHPARLGDFDPPSSLHHVSSEAEAEVEELAKAEKAREIEGDPEDAAERQHVFTVPTQPLPRILIPSSQATTIDMTQPSPQRRTQRQKQLLTQDIPSSSPPPPIPPTLSSPTFEREGNGQSVPWEWDGRRWTDSQLLPASLMQDSFARPPPLPTDWDIGDE